MALDDRFIEPGLAASAASLLSDFSVEVTPAEIAREPGLLAGSLIPGTRVYITFLPNTAFSDTVAAAAAVIREGMRPVPHLAARGIADAGDLDRMVGRLAETGVRELLVIAGSVSRPAGPISESMQVLSSGVLERHGITRVGVAGHPEGNRDIGDQALARALTAKNAFAADEGADVYLLTQFCFDAGPVVRWEERIGAAGNRLPVYVGLPGLASPARLLRFGISCGVGPSLRVLRKQASGVLKLATTAVYYPDQTLLSLARSVRDDPESLIRGVHFFPFGALRATAAWATWASGMAGRASPR